MNYGQISAGMKARVKPCIPGLDISMQENGFSLPKCIYAIIYGKKEGLKNTCFFSLLLNSFAFLTSIMAFGIHLEFRYMPESL